jgi:hypothetical protein
MLKQQHDCSNEQEMRATQLFVNCCVLEQICCTIGKIRIDKTTRVIILVGFEDFGVKGSEVNREDLVVSGERWVFD